VRRVGLVAIVPPVAEIRTAEIRGRLTAGTGDLPAAAIGAPHPARWSREQGGRLADTVAELTDLMGALNTVRES